MGIFWLGSAKCMWMLKTFSLDEYTNFSVSQLWQIVHLVGVIYYTLYRDWPWIQTVSLAPC